MTRAEHARRRELVLALSQEGHDQNAIAERLGVTRSLIARDVAAMKRAGIVCKNYSVLEIKVIELAKQGLSPREIAHQLGIGERRPANIISKARYQYKEDIPRVKNKHRGKGRITEDSASVDQRVISMRKEGKSYREIGNVFQVTGEAIRTRLLRCAPELTGPPRPSRTEPRPVRLPKPEKRAKRMGLL